MIVARKHSEIGVATLFGVVVSQAIGYGMIFDLQFFLRFTCFPLKIDPS